jgi:hypothetical protein
MAKKESIPGDYRDRAKPPVKSAKPPAQHVSTTIGGIAPATIPPAGGEPSTDVRVIQAEVRAAADLHLHRIESHNQRSKDLLEQMEKLRDETQSHANVFGWTLTLSLFFGLGIGLFTLFYMLHQSMESSVKSIVGNRVREKVDAVDWKPLVDAAAKEQVERKITADALANAVDDDRIAQAAASVLESEAFNSRLLEQVNSAAVAGANEAVKKFIEGNDYFKQAIDRQLAARRDELRKSMEVAVPITAANREQLREQLLATILSYQQLRQENTLINVYPFKEPTRVRATIWLRTGQPKEEQYWPRLQIDEIGAAAPDKRQAIEKYLDRETSDSVQVKRNGSTSAPQFVEGYYYDGQSSHFSTYEQCANTLATDVITLIDECFGIEYPIEWRVTSGN